MSVQLPVYYTMLCYAILCYAMLCYAMLCDGVDAAVHSRHRCEGKGVAHIASRDDEKCDRNFKKTDQAVIFETKQKNYYSVQLL